MYPSASMIAQGLTRTQAARSARPVTAQAPNVRAPSPHRAEFSKQCREVHAHAAETVRLECYHDEHVW